MLVIANLLVAVYVSQAEGFETKKSKYYIHGKKFYMNGSMHQESGTQPWIGFWLSWAI